MAQWPFMGPPGLGAAARAWHLWLIHVWSLSPVPGTQPLKPLASPECGGLLHANGWLGLVCGAVGGGVLNSFRKRLVSGKTKA